MAECQEQDGGSPPDGTNNILLIMNDNSEENQSIAQTTITLTNSQSSFQDSNVGDSLIICNKDGGQLDSTTQPVQPNSTESKKVEVVQIKLAPEVGSDGITCNLDDEGFPRCIVCSDRASGFHYSAFSCEGCKGFFKRTVQKKLTYTCKNNQSCVINKYTRNSCQFCRFRKCLRMGMKRDAVREDRSPGGKHRKRQRTEETGSQFSSFPADHTDLNDSLIESLVAARPDTFPAYEGSQPDISSTISVNDLMHYAYAELKYIIEWAKKVPGFRDLDMPDQMALLKSSFMELNVLRLAYRSMGMDNTVKFCEGIVLSSDYIFSMGWGSELIGATIEFASRLAETHIDRTEFCILNAIVLTYPDAIGIKDKLTIVQLQTRFLDALQRYIKHHYPSDTRKYGKMLLRLPSLRTVSAKAAERFLSLTLDGSIQLNDLVLEMIN
ncbi:retinoic acid receptor RXR-alpha-B-like [Gigantopelta aegis]|uniref:retinoic acid receptor RXR-alpha-B-like n=1 Tax=Gigantopelta aegis TaxID=1735272 RepID=UPI001B88DA5C|nr:retinoic acid receptor RXR-alpha-B-like [Gigantopelta aegis]